MAGGDSDLKLDLDLDRALSSVEEAIDRERGVAAWLRSRPTGVRLLIASVSVAVAAALAVTLGGTWRQLTEAGAASRPIVLAGYLALLGVTLRYGLRPMQQIESVWASRLLTGVGVGLPFLAAAFPLHDSHEIPGERGYCVVLGLLLGAVLVGLMRWLDRGAHANRRSALLAAAAAALGSNLALEFHCPIDRFAHRAAFHASVGVVLWVAIVTLNARRAPQPRVEA